MNETNYLNLFRRKRKRGNLTSKSKGEIKQTPEILDMDKLHNIDKPSKKVLFTRKINSMSRSNTSQIELRKSERTRNKLTEMELNAINCHECKTIKLTSHIQTCSNVECCESYCMGCIAKYPSVI